MKILILGGGISGLSVAWFCRRRYENAEIVLLEKEARLGGWIQTRRDSGFLFEEGPRTFPLSRSPHLKELISELGLEKEILLSSAASQKRYLWHRGKLRSIFSLLPRFIPAMIRGRFVANPEGDLSIYDFIEKKYGAKVAETLIDPLVKGIYGGDIRKLSIASCFPDWQKQKGFRPPSGKLFALKGGMRRLIEELQKQLKMEIHFNSPVEELRSDGVIAQGKVWDADQIFTALPAEQLGRLSGFWPDFPKLSLWRVFLAYAQPVLPKPGFGYLIPSQENEAVMGMVWDSEIFPQQNLSTETRITVMIQDEVKDPMGEALSAAKRHLNIVQRPIYGSLARAERAIPQFEVGYNGRLAAWKKDLAVRFPKLRIAGNYLNGASVEGCVRSAKEAVG